MDLDSSRLKRQRSFSSSSASSSNSDASSSSLTPPPLKFHRLPSQQGTYECLLPPTCSPNPTYYTSSAELDRHQETFHRYICRIPVRDRDAVHTSGPDKGKGKEIDGLGEVPEGFVHQRGQKRWKECCKVFPEQRLLDLHQSETHDPLAREKQVKGEKIFACFLPPEQCKKRFIDPRQRRLHLIAKHKYPKEYFFSITNHGLNDLVRQDGLAISLIRPRKDLPINAKQPAESTKSAQAVSEVGLTEEAAQVKGGTNRIDESGKEEKKDVDMDELTNAMSGMESSLSFVPRGVRKKATAKAMD